MYHENLSRRVCVRGTGQIPEVLLTNPYQLPAADLAYLGDAVYEIEVRAFLVKNGVKTPSVASLAYVKATAQSAAMEKILPHLTEAENDVYRRGRNCIHNVTPKSCTPSEYRRATGLEALFGYLWLMGNTDRIHALCRIGIGIGDTVDTDSAPPCADDTESGV